MLSIVWIKQGNSEWWGAQYPQFYIHVEGVQGYILTIVRSPTAKVITYRCKTIQKAKAAAKKRIDLPLFSQDSALIE